MSKILVDYSYLSHRMIFVAQAEIQKTPKHMLMLKENIEDYNEIIKGDMEKSAAVTDMYYHLVLNNLISIKKKFKVKSEDVYLCLDGKSWRKDFYKEYKANRKKSRDESPIEWNEFYKTINTLLEIIDKTTKFNIIGTENAEGDDIMFHLSEHFSSEGEETIVVTSDKDIKQVLRFDNVKMYDPMKGCFVSDFNEETLLKHCLIGDISDNIPNIKVGSEFTKEFITYLKQNNIFLESVSDVSELEIYNKLLEEYEEEKIFKSVRFGEKTAQKAIDNGEVEEILSNETFKKNFERNVVLIDMRHIPEYVIEQIKEKFNSIEPKVNDMFTLQDWLVSRQLKSIQKDMGLLLV